MENQFIWKGLSSPTLTQRAENCQPPLAYLTLCDLLLRAGKVWSGKWLVLRGDWILDPVPRSIVGINGHLTEAPKNSLSTIHPAHAYVGPHLHSYTECSGMQDVLSSLLFSRQVVSFNPWISAYQASLSFTISHSLLKFMSIELVLPSNHLILCSPLLLLPSIFPSMRIFSSESALHIRWPKYWSFSFSISPSKNIQDWFPLGWTGWILLQSRGLSRVFSSTAQFESIGSSALSKIRLVVLWGLYLQTSHCHHLFLHLFFFFYTHIPWLGLHLILQSLVDIFGHCVTTS